jgi:metal-responsive CopG/Arc/MetJ family transcriptional regulator
VILLDTTPPGGYTSGMKTAISIPDSIFQAAEKHAKRMRKSRSQLFSEAMVEYLERHTPDEITRMLNETLETVVSDMDNSFIWKASHSLLGRSEW